MEPVYGAGEKLAHSETGHNLDTPNTPGRIPRADSTRRGYVMANKAQRSNKEKKKPKAEKGRPKQVSAYKQAMSGGGSSIGAKKA